MWHLSTFKLFSATEGIMWGFVYLFVTVPRITPFFFLSCKKLGNSLQGRSLYYDSTSDTNYT